MKIGIISDIHGNDAALKVVLADALSVGVEHLLILGDIVGYYYSPDIVLRQLEDWSYDMISGNHEHMLAKSLTDDSYLEKISSKYGSGIKVAIDKLSKEQVTRLSNLPDSLTVNIDGLNIGLYHGSPNDVDEYVYPDAELKLLKKISRSGDDFVLMGHTHYPMCVHIDGVTIVNPGSVGQPRDIGGLASWAIINTNNNMVIHRRVKFPVEKLIQVCLEKDPENEYLRSVLMRDVNL